MGFPVWGKAAVATCQIRSHLVRTDFSGDLGFPGYVGFGFSVESPYKLKPRQLWHCCMFRSCRISSSDGIIGLCSYIDLRLVNLFMTLRKMIVPMPLNTASKKQAH